MNQATQTRHDFLVNHRMTMRKYLVEKFEDEDWHGVEDAASDLRDIDAELRGIRVGLWSSEA